MSFRPLTRREVCWRTWDGQGLQRVAIWRDAGGICAEGTAAVAGPAGYAAAFRIDCFDDWRVRSADIRIAGGATLTLRSDGQGRWSDALGNRLPALEGCIDIDLAASPLTNILPIRRVDLADGEAREFRMAYVPFPALEPFVDAQRYTCLAACRRYLYEAVDGTFAAEIAVDADGLVEDYPGLFRRVP